MCGAWAVTNPRIGALYKNMEIDFHRRVDEDLYLMCLDVSALDEGGRKAEETGERVNVPICVEGYCYSYSTEKPVVSARMTLSMKKK